MNGFSPDADHPPLSGAEGQTPRVIIRAANHEVTADNGYRLTQKPAPGFSTAWRVVGHDNNDLWVDLDGHWDAGTGITEAQASEVEVYPGANSLCMTSIDIANPYGARGPIVTGDVGWWCGHSSYLSGWYNTQGEQIRCMWLGRSTAPGATTIHGFSFDGAYFNMQTAVDHQEIMDNTCNVENINFNRENVYPLGDEWLSKRDEKPSDPFEDGTIADALIVSDGEGAEAICNDNRMYGQSFYSIEEKMLCYMPTRELYPSCGDNVSDTCFDEDTNTVVDHKKRDKIDFYSKIKWSKPAHIKRGDSFGGYTMEVSNL